MDNHRLVRKHPLILPFLLLTAAALVFRLPAMINAGDLNSDAAVVGLQAMHMLRGEWSLFAWGAGYVSSLESAMTAVVFMVIGASPLALTLAPILGQLVMIWLALSVLHRRVGVWPATLCVLPLVLAPWAINYVINYAVRQWAVTLVFLSIWLIDTAGSMIHDSSLPPPDPSEHHGNGWELIRYALGCLVGALAVFADLFAAVFLPGILVLAGMTLLDGSPGRRVVVRRTMACIVGFIIGGGVLVLSRLVAEMPAPQTSLSIDRIAPNAALLWNTCLPFSLGHALLADSENLFQRTLRLAPMPWRVFQIVGGWSLIVGIVIGGTMVVSKLPWQVRRLGAFGAIVMLSALGAFLLSVMPVDMWSARYLGPIFWAAPFGLAPLAARLGTRRFALAIAPYLIVATIGGWLSYGLWVAGPLPRLSKAGAAVDEQRLCEFLRSRQIRYAAADYWIAYRQTFLCREDPIVVTLVAWMDRYEPYRKQFLAERRKALIFHPLQSRQPREPFEQYLKANHIRYETVQVGKFSVLLTE